MIEKFRRYVKSGNLSTKSMVAIVLFGAIILVFMFFGLPTHHAGALGGYAARVNDRYISFADLREEVNRREQYFRQFGGQFGGENEMRRIREEALSSLVERELLNQTAKSSGIQVSDGEVRDFITKEIPEFQRDGKFQRDVYRQSLDYTGQSAGEFEEKIRQHLRSQRSLRVFESVGEPSSVEAKKDSELKSTKLNVSFVKIDKDKITAGFSGSEKDIRAKLADEGFKKRVESDLEINRSQYEKPEEVRASHILIRIDDATPEAKALEKIKAIQARLSKEDFGKVAAEVSEDPGSKAKKGDLGFFGRGMMVPEFDKVAFSAPIGKISEPVKSDFGYHLIKVVEKKAASKTPQDQAEFQIAKKLLASDQFEAEVKGLEDALSQGQSDKVDEFLKKWKLSWEDTGAFDLSQEFIAKLGSMTASQAAFEVTQEKPLLPKIVRDGDAKFLLKWKSVSKETKAGDTLAQMQSAKYKSYDLVGKWMEKEKRSAKIEMNPAAISGR